ncbi:hypothetical protein HanOQP8_Chr01g0006691 [Helianthus annuus]|nr:hypothetical protein HanOQP8_Chr01g0006691 [Helianthus annuus]
MHLENSVTDFISSAFAQQVNGAGLLHTTYGTPKHVALEEGQKKHQRLYMGKSESSMDFYFFRGVYDITQRVCKHNWFFTLERSWFVLYYHSPFHLSSDTCKRPSRSSFYCV